MKWLRMYGNYDSPSSIIYRDIDKQSSLYRCILNKKTLPIIYEPNNNI